MLERDIDAAGPAALRVEHHMGARAGYRSAARVDIRLKHAARPTGDAAGPAASARSTSPSLLF
jgi:hypothetical protein